MDHFGGFGSAVPEIANAKKSNKKESDDDESSVSQEKDEKLVVDLSAPHIIERGIKIAKTGAIAKLLPDTPTVSEFEDWGARVELHGEPHTAGNDCFYVSGPIPRVTSFETGLPNHYSRMQESGEFVLDPEVRDERYLAVKIKGRGVIVFSSCSHAGIVNVCKDVTETLDSKLVAVVGGFHLAGRNTEDRINHTISGLKELEPDLILAGHCTGWKAKARFAFAFEYNFQVLSVGGRYTFKSM